MTSPPGLGNDFLAPLARVILDSHRRLTGRPLLDGVDTPQALFEAPVAVLAHDTAPDPVFIYANRLALELFGYAWDEWVRLPSRLSAGPADRAERERMLRDVAAKGWADGYSGVRMARDGRRFTIQDAAVWNLADEAGNPVGQAAVIRRWSGT